MDDNIIEHLIPMFPQLTREVIQFSVLHASNRYEPLDEGHLLQRCIDDLLELRTYCMESSFEEPRDGSPHNDVLMTVVQPPRSALGHCPQDVIFISDSPLCEYSDMSSPRPSSTGGASSDHRLTVGASPSPVVTEEPAWGQRLAAVKRPTVTEESTHNSEGSQSTSVHHNDDTDLPDIGSPVARRHTMGISSAVTHNATLSSYSSSAASHKALSSTLHTPTATTHNASPSAYRTPAVTTHNAPPPTYHTPATGTHNASPSTYHTPAVSTHDAPPSTFHTPAASTHDAPPSTFHTPAASTHDAPAVASSIDALASTFHTPAMSTSQERTINILLGASQRLPVTDTSLMSTRTGGEEHTSATSLMVSSESTHDKTIASSTGMAGAKTVSLASTGMAGAKTIPSASTSVAGAKTVRLPSTSMAGAKTIPLASAGMADAKTVTLASTGIADAKTVPLTSTSMAGAKTISSASAGMAGATTVTLATTGMVYAKTVPSASTGMAGAKTVPSASTSTVGTANVTIPSASTSVLTSEVKLAPQATAAIPFAAPLVVPSTSEEQPKSREEKLEDLTQEVCCVFTDADRNYVKDLLRHSFYPDPVNAVCNYMLEEKNYLRVKKVDPLPLLGPSLPPVSTPQSTVTRTPEVDYYNDRQNVSDLYKNNCITQLQYEFRKIASKSIHRIASHFGYHYAPTRRALTQAEHHFKLHVDETTLELADFSGNVAKFPVVRLKGKRSYRHPVNISHCPELQEEVVYVKQEGSREQKALDKPAVVSVSEDLFQETEATIECGCCYDDCCFENMVQCSDGHLFCRKCVENYTRESVFGQGKANLVCMTDSCDAIYPKSQLEVALPADLLSQFESRMQEEAINLAAMTDLVRCPHCDFAAILDHGDKVFRCVECQKATCRYCKENWEEHIGIPCKELEKKDETKIRLAFEEKMTEAKIRVCHRCKARFTKLDGCNKMTCRCGTRMCYICRKPDIDYNHFCQHVRDPGRGCKTCNACSLWTNPDEDEERAIVELKKEAQLARKEQGYTEDKTIGASVSPVKKKRRVEH